MFKSMIGHLGTFRRLTFRRLSVVSSNYKPKELDGLHENEFEPKTDEKKCLKIAVIGMPNSGKSTLINQIVKRPVCGVSAKVHTTRKRALAACNRGNVQLLFVDTPGLVDQKEIKKYHLGDGFDLHWKETLTGADVIGVIHDASDHKTNERIDFRILNRLDKYALDKPTFLILNKVDILRNKRLLLRITEILTNSCVPDRSIRNRRTKEKEKEKENGKASEEKKEEKPPPVGRGWSHFKEVFMVSALKDEGIDYLVERLLLYSKNGSWLLPEYKATDVPPSRLISELVRCQVYDALHFEVPYETMVETELFEENDLGEITCVVLVLMKRNSHKIMFLKHIVNVAKNAEALASNVLQTVVRLRIVVKSLQKPTPFRPHMNRTPEVSKKFLKEHKLDE